MIVAQAVENQFFGDTGINLRAQRLLRPRQNMPLQCRWAGMLKVQQFGGADIGGKHHVVTAQVERFSSCNRDAGGVKNLQREIKDARMRFFNFVKEQRADPGSFVNHCQHPAFSRGASQEQRQTLLRLILRHVKSKDVLGAQ